MQKLYIYIVLVECVKCVADCRRMQMQLLSVTMANWRSQACSGGSDLRLTKTTPYIDFSSPRSYYNTTIPNGGLRLLVPFRIYMCAFLSICICVCVYLLLHAKYSFCHVQIRFLHMLSLKDTLTQRKRDIHHYLRFIHFVPIQIRYTHAVNMTNS